MVRLNILCSGHSKINYEGTMLSSIISYIKGGYIIFQGPPIYGCFGGWIPLIRHYKRMSVIKYFLRKIFFILSFSWPTYWFRIHRLKSSPTLSSSLLFLLFNVFGQTAKSLFTQVACDQDWTYFNGHTKKILVKFPLRRHLQRVWTLRTKK